MTAKKILDNLLRMQETLRENMQNEDREYIEREIIDEGTGRVGEVWIEGEGGGVFKLCVDNDGNLTYADEKTNSDNIIKLSIDTFIAILLREMTFQQAYMRGNVSVEGENWFYHAVKFIKGLKRLEYPLYYILKERGNE